MTSESLVVLKIEPSRSMRWRRVCAFTRLPLCASAAAPRCEATWIGWAFCRWEEPVVE